MLSATTSRLSLPRICKGLSQSLTISGAFGVRQKSKKAARRKQPTPNKSTEQKKRRPTHPKAELQRTVLQIQSAVDTYLTLDPDSLPKMEPPKMDELIGNKTRVGNKEHRETTEQAQSEAVERQPKQAEVFKRRSVNGKSKTTNVVVGGNQAPRHRVWTPINANNGSHGGNNGMTPQSSSTQNNFNASNTDMAQYPNAYGGFQPNFFTSQMGINMNFPQSMDPNFFNPNFLPNIQGLSLNGNSYHGQQTPNAQPWNNNMAAAAPFTPSPQSRNRHKQPITAPSAASGGVPDPTDAYVLRASFLPRRRAHPGPLLVVIDLNGTLLYRRNIGASFERRQHAERFVDYCIRTFWVVIWSSAKPENVTRMVAQLLPPDLRSQVVAVWARDKFGLDRGDYERRTQCYKRLTRLWDDPEIQRAFPTGRPGLEGGSDRWDQGNTVLIDDSLEKARSEPNNAVTLPEFTGGRDEDGMDVLPAVHDYLNELCYQEDASAYMRAHPFKMPERVDTR